MPDRAVLLAASADAPALTGTPAHRRCCQIAGIPLPCIAHRPDIASSARTTTASVACAASHAPADEPPRQIVLQHRGQQHAVPYLLRHSPRARRLGLRIDRHGLSVTLPQRARVSQRDIDALLNLHAGWIVDKLGTWQERAARHEQQRVRFEDGALLPLLGEQIRLRTHPLSEHRRTRIQPLGDELWVSGPAARDDTLLPAAVTIWLRRHALQVFAQRLPPWAERLGRQPRSLGLSSARTRWGSCARNGDIRLNWRLIQFAPELIDYVIAHELAHLVEMNHSPRFWAQLEALMPDYRQHKAALARAVDAYL